MDYFLCIGVSLLSLGSANEDITVTSVGGLGGMEFDDYDYWSGERITEVKLGCSHIVDYVQMTYGSTKALHHGGTITDGIQTHTLCTEEYITTVRVWYSNYVDGIILETNQRSFALCGQKTGNNFTFNNGRLQYISGRAGEDAHIHSLTFHWTRADVCDTHPCRNNGTCFSNGESYACKCQDGYSGSSCKIADVCKPNPCKNNGMCFSNNTSYFCKCGKEYTGSSCEIRDSCAASPCQNNGTCYSHEESYSCKCQDGFVGSICEKDKISHCRDVLNLNDYKALNSSQLQLKIEKLKMHLTLKKWNTSLQRRRKVSASDSRTSATITGYVLGASVLIAVATFILCLDIVNIRRNK